MRSSSFLQASQNTEERSKMVKGVAASLLLVLAVAHLMADPAGALSCVDVISAVRPCLGYVTGRQPTPPPGCCDSLKRLNSAARTTPDRRTVCNCVKQTASHVRNLKEKLVAALPGQCSISLPYPLLPSIDCNKIT